MPIARFALPAELAWAAPPPPGLEVEPAEVRLVESDSRAQLVASGRDAHGQRPYLFRWDRGIGRGDHLIRRT